MITVGHANYGTLIYVRNGDRAVRFDTPAFMLSPSGAVMNTEAGHFLEHLRQVLEKVQE